MSRGRDHYFSERPASARREGSFDAELRGEKLTLLFDAGVFSKGRVDRGTRLLIERAPLPERGAVLDWGCGYGPIGLAIAKHRPDLEVYMVDVNERAVELAKRAAAMNGIENVRLFQGDGFQALPGDVRFAAVLSNPPFRAGNAVVFRLVEEARDWLEDGGAFACVAQTKQGAKRLRDHMERVFGNVAQLEVSGGYRVMESRRDNSVM